MTSSHFLIGLDLGQVVDYTALVIVERTEGENGDGARYDVRHLDRVRDVSYPHVVAHTKAIVDALLADTPRPELNLVIDFTGVGRPVADMFKEEHLQANVRLVTITAGDAETVGDRGEWRVPKRNLASGVQVLLQSGRLRIGSDLPLATILTEELRNFRVKITLAGRDTYGAGDDWREGSHDDLVLALALACWQGEREPRLGPIVIPIFRGGTFFPMGPEFSDLWDDDDNPWQ